MFSQCDKYQLNLLRALRFCLRRKRCLIAGERIISVIGMTLLLWWRWGRRVERSMASVLHGYDKMYVLSLIGALSSYIYIYVHKWCLIVHQHSAYNRIYLGQTNLFHSPVCFVPTGSSLCRTISISRNYSCRSQWPRGLRRGSAAARLQGLRVRILSRAWMSVCCECCVLSGREVSATG